MYLHKTPFWAKWLWPGCEWSGAEKQQCLYLTFDDGPVPEVTDWVLATLAEYEAQATFFCVGDNIRKNPEVYQRIWQAGHRTANHTFNHLSGWQTPLSAYLQNIRLCQGYLREESKLFRPPYGKITGQQRRALQQAGYRIVLWQTLAGDFDPKLAPKTCLSRTLKASQAGGIVVFHDSPKTFPTLKFVLPRYLAHFRKRGYRFLSL